MIADGLRLAAAFARQVARPSGGSLCGACVDVLAVSGAGITLLGGHEAGPLCVSNEQSSRLEDLQFLLGEGPCQDAFNSGAPVHAPALDAASRNRWPVFTEEALAVGVGAMFAYPLAATLGSTGVLTLYQDSPGDLTADQATDALALAQVLADTIVQLQSDARGQVPAAFDDAVAHRAEVHQAAGMVAVQMHVRVGEALAVLRSYAFAHGLSISDVSRDVIARRVRFTERNN